MEVVVIDKVKEKWGALGNMSAHPIVFEGVEWPRAEQLFQALRMSCPDLREEIRAVKNPMAAKMLSKKLRKEHPDKVVVEPLSEEDVSNMASVLELKLEQHKEVRELLEETGERKIVEDCTRRQRGSGLFWGAALQEDGSWEGKNWLGELWMLVRKEAGYGSA